MVAQIGRNREGISLVRMRGVLLCAVALQLGAVPAGAGAEQRPGTVIQGAKLQLKNPAKYTIGYFKLKYPGGDLPADQGVCTDVVIRALRHAGHDLQKLIREDMKLAFSTYPRREAKPDPNIDHRRVPNQIHFFKRYGTALGTEATKGTWKAGDIVYWKLPNGLDHCGIISDRLNAKGLPLVIHNIRETAEEDVLTAWKIVGHYRYPKARP